MEGKLPHKRSRLADARKRQTIRTSRDSQRSDCRVGEGSKNLNRAWREPSYASTMRLLCLPPRHRENVGVQIIRRVAFSRGGRQVRELSPFTKGLVITHKSPNVYFCYKCISFSYSKPAFFVSDNFSSAAFLYLLFNSRLNDPLIANAGVAQPKSSNL